MKIIKVDRRIIFAALILTTPLPIFGQGTLADYERADSLQALAPKLLYHAVEDVVWMEDSNQFSYRINTRRGKEFVFVDAEARTREAAFDQEKLAAALSVKFDTTYAAYALPFDRVTFKTERSQMEFAMKDTLWTCDLNSYELTKGMRVEPPRRRRQSRDEEYKPVVSPDKKWEAYTKNFNLYIRSKQSGEEFQLSHDGSEGYYYDMAIQWAPDSQKLITNRVRPGYERLVHYVESSPEDQVQPKHSTRFYAKPGDMITIRKPNLFLVETKKQIPVDDALFLNPYHIRNVAWRKDSRAFTFNYNQRGHQVYRIIEVNAATGQVRALVDEQSDTFFSYYGKLYRHDVNDGEEIIWMSERDGWNHLYLYDGKTGQVKDQITKGKWVVRRSVRYRDDPSIYVDDEKRQIIFSASGREKNHDPYLVHFYRINFDGSGLKRLTEGNANHRGEFSADRKFFVDTYSRVDVPPVSVLRRASDGQVVMELEKADVSELLATGLKPPEVFSAKGRDGKTDIWGIINRPSNFDPQKTYRVIEYIYAGPHSSFVPKSFRAFHRMQAMAELGFIVVQIDGMGTSNRSKAF
ncbi:S9 family peptidase, partial [bacterium]|nr:S9 family peptidase [bacterium]